MTRVLRPTEITTTRVGDAEIAKYLAFGPEPPPAGAFVLSVVLRGDNLGVPVAPFEVIRNA